MYPPEKLVLPDNIGITAEGEPPLRRKGVPAQLAEQVPKEEWRQVWSAHLALTTMADDVLGMILEELKKQGKKSVHFLVCKTNKKALRSYEKLHFDVVGESDLFDEDWWCYEKAL